MMFSDSSPSSPTPNRRTSLRQCKTVSLGADVQAKSIPTKTRTSPQKRRSVSRIHVVSDSSHHPGDSVTETLTDPKYDGSKAKRRIKTQKGQQPTSSLVGTGNMSRTSFTQNDPERSSHQFTRIPSVPRLKGESDAPLASTPSRCRKQPCPHLSSTPEHNVSTTEPLPVSLPPVEGWRRTCQDSLPTSERKESNTTSSEKASEIAVISPRRVRGRPRKNLMAVKQQEHEKWTQSCFPADCPPVKHREGLKTRGDDENTNCLSNLSSSSRLEPLSEAESPDQVKSNPEETTLSSDLSIELSLQEDHLTSLPLLGEFEEEEEEEDEEELPSFLIQIDKRETCKQKAKKASIVFIDDQLLDKKRIHKGFSVALKTLKPFDCEEADELMEKAKEKYEDAISWCLELITDYRIRIGCDSFTGSFIEYFADDISSPVRKRYQGRSALTFPTQLIMEEDYVALEEDESSREQPGVKKLLPDRSKAARNRANDKLLTFIIKQRRVEKRLLAVISGQQQSRWLRSFLRTSRTVVDTYLEDEDQLDQLYLYLKGVFDQASCTARCLLDVDRIRFVLDVLLPEAIIYAIAGVDKVSLERAEDKYLKGPCLSKREKEEFDLMIEQQMKPEPKIPA